MNRQQLEERIEGLKQSQEQLKQQFATIAGHLNESQFWLDELNKLEAQAVSELPECNVDENA